MKKIIYGVLFLAVVGISIVRCQKDEIQEKSKENITNQDVQSEKRIATESNLDFAKSLRDLNSYLKDMEAKPDYTFFNYWLNNPSSTLSDLEDAGYLNKSIMLSKFKAIESNAKDLDNDTVWRLITENIDPLFYYDGSGGESTKRFCIFCCTGCMDGIKHNACYT